MELQQGNSLSSSMDSSSHPAPSSSSSLSTDLRLDLSLSTTSSLNSSPNQRSLPEIESHQSHRAKSFFVKVYMEGIPIGRKLDLFVHESYESLLKALRRMFRTTITYPGLAQVPSSNAHVLTYEDKEGDWMMVGDVPWELFLSTVKKLKVARADNCCKEI